MKKPVIFEMETSDPDDFLTLCWLADHPDVDLVAVLVTPGGEDQCRIVRWALDQCKNTAPIGTVHGPSWWKTEDAKKQRVSAFHYKVFGDELMTYPTGDVIHGPSFLRGLLEVEKTPSTNPADFTNENLTVLVGSAPKNIGKALTEPGELGIDPSKLVLGRWVMQGGFAGDNLVAPEHRLEKFKGKLTCPSYNPGGDPKSTLALLAHPGIQRRIFVSKNVCHGVRWTQKMAEGLSSRLQSKHWDAAQGRGELYFHHIVDGLPVSPGWPTATRMGLKLMVQGFDDYLRYGTGPQKPEWEMESEKAGHGKAMHDLVAAAAVLDERVCSFTEVEIYREKGNWGARAAEHTNTFISTAFNREHFLDVLSR